MFMSRVVDRVPSVSYLQLDININKGTTKTS